MGPRNTIDETSRHLAEINMVPLIDVMLVLLIIFIITAPLLTHTLKIELPQTSMHIAEPQSPVELSISNTGEIYWNGEPVNKITLENRMKTAAKTTPLPELHIRADRHTSYEQVAFAISLANRTGLVKIGFVIQPEGL